MKRSRSIPFLASILCFLLAVALILGVTRSLRQDSLRRQRQALEEAIGKSLLLCYSLEGCYPETLEELLERCPLAYDRDLFAIDYRLQGGNLLPDVTVLEK